MGLCPSPVSRACARDRTWTYGLCRRARVKLRSPWVRVALNTVTSVLLQEGRGETHGERPREDRHRDGVTGHRQGTREPWELEEVGRPLPGDSEGGVR